jgi:hypothetical protein
VRLWKRLDASRPNSVPGIRAATSLAPLAGLDDAVITLPVKLGGLGFLSFKTSALLSFAAASEVQTPYLHPTSTQPTKESYRSVNCARKHS